MYSSFQSAPVKPAFKSYNGPRAKPLPVRFAVARQADWRASNHRNDPPSERSSITFSKPGTVLASPDTVQSVSCPHFTPMEVGSSVCKAVSEAGSQASPLVVEDLWIDVEDSTSEAPRPKCETSCEAVYIGPRPLPSHGQAHGEEGAFRRQSHEATDETALLSCPFNAKPQPSQHKQDVDAHAESQATSSGDEDADTVCNDLRRQHDGGAEPVQQTTPRRNWIIGGSQARDHAGSNHGSDTDKSSVDDNDDNDDEDDNAEGSGHCSITSRPKKRSHLDSPNHTCDSSAYRSEHVMQTILELARTPRDESGSDSADSPSPIAVCSSMKQASVPVLVSTAHWDVESISSKRKRDGRIEYRVDWASTWHDAEALDNCKELIRDFERSERSILMRKKRRLYH